MDRQYKLLILLDMMDDMRLLIESALDDDTDDAEKKKGEGPKALELRHLRVHQGLHDRS